MQGFKFSVLITDSTLVPHCNNWVQHGKVQPLILAGERYIAPALLLVDTHAFPQSSTKVNTHLLFACESKMKPIVPNYLIILHIFIHQIVSVECIYIKHR